MQTISDLQKDIWSKYKTAIELPENYSYLYGNPVKVHVPVDTAQNSLMIIGAYPTAHFNTINGIADVPVSDHLCPFSNESYFNGSRVRYVRSGAELEELFLRPLKLSRGDCWITDLVKVFLFKDGHIERYKALGYNHIKANRDMFMSYAKKSLSFIYKEIELANPKIILALGEEVTSVILGIPKSRAQDYMKGKASDLIINGKKYTVLGAPHPGILMRNSERSAYWGEVLKEDVLPMVKKKLN